MITRYPTASPLTIVNNTGAYGSNQTVSDTPYYSFVITPGDIRVEDEVGTGLAPDIPRFRATHKGIGFDDSTDTVYLLGKNGLTNTHFIIASKQVGTTDSWASEYFTAPDARLDDHGDIEYSNREQKLYFLRPELNHAGDLNIQLGNSKEHDTRGYKVKEAVWRLIFAWRKRQ